ncbi:MAG TPA: GAF domain-containing SpoIIE family protein phosphatase, partial [Candidatus Angelobacter sp.]|nr:GAF domain-containing SpoIIE family protein phosphatase [Candidatus Angelobacter sp.]
MDGLAVVKTKTQGRDYVNAFATAVAALSRAGEDITARVLEMLVSDFEAARAELWLWDSSSGSCYLTHAEGLKATHRLDYAAAGAGAVGKIAHNKTTIENIVLSTFGGDDQEFARATGLSHISGYPLLAAGQLAGVLTIYTTGEVAEDLLLWWRLYSEMSSAKLNNVLATQEKDKHINQLSLLFEATRLLNSTLDLAELLELILKIARTEVKAERGTVFLVDQKRKEIWSIAASGLDHQELRIPFGKGVAGRVAVSGELVNTEDAYSLDFFDPSFDQRLNYRTKSLLSIPIRHHSGEIVGVLQLLNAQNGRFTPEDIGFLTRLSGHMAMALENAQMHRDTLEKQRIERELSLARSILHRLLPEAPPVVPGYDIAVLSDFCFDVAADYYDFINLGPQSLLLVSAEVEGKGVTSALIMANLQATLRALVMHLHSLEVLAFSLNEMLYTYTRSGKHLGVFLGLIDTRRNVLQYVNAGHVPPILVKGKSGEVKMLEEGGTVIGLFPQADYGRGTIKLEKDDLLVCTTDGIPHIADEQKHEYGLRRLTDCVRRHRERGAQGVLDAVLAEVSAYSTASMNDDDKVLIAVKVTADKEGGEDPHAQDPQA